MDLIFQNQNVKWINLHNPSYEELTAVAKTFNFLQLTIADSLEPGHLPKFETDESISFLLVRYFDKEDANHSNIVREFSHKLSIYFGKDFIITVYQVDNKLIQNVKQQYIESQESHKITRKGILYYLLSEVLNTFEAPALKMDEKIDVLEEMIFTAAIDQLKLQHLYHLKREAAACKKILDYTLEALKEYELSNRKSSTLQDLKEDCIKMLHMHTQIVDDVQNLLSIYLSLNSQKSNDIMKTLTIFSAFFLPLTFIVGIYGMNFSYMPELNYKWGYPITLLVMLGIVVLIFIWFKRKRYL